MKFDIISALDRAEVELGYPVSINCSKSEEDYLVQIKAIIPHFPGARGSRVYGQQIAFTKGEILNDDYWMLRDRFAKAVASLKRQIEE